MSFHPEPSERSEGEHADDDCAVDKRYPHSKKIVQIEYREWNQCYGQSKR